LGAFIAWAIHSWGGVPIAAAVGILSGATTNTPSLGAAQQALQTLPGLAENSASLPGLGYAVTYPFGILGIILAMLLVRALFQVKIKQEEESFHKQQTRRHPKVSALNLCVTNPNLAGVAIKDIPGLENSGVVISRLEQNGVAQVARDESVLQVGNTLLAVGSQKEIEKLRVVVGAESHLDLRAHSGNVNVRRIVLTSKNVFGRSLEDLDLEAQHGVRFTRISRAEVDLPNPAVIRLQAGDTLTVVGEDDALQKVEKILGNSMKDLNQAHVLPVFIGIVLGIILGSIPVLLPGMPAPVKLGLAGGPLVVAILLSYMGRVGPLAWHMPPNANFLLREIGIVLFLACVGLKAGGSFVETLLKGDGLYWMTCGAAITLIPLVVVGIVGRAVLKINYLTLCGVLAGSMTDPPALAFANATTTTEAPAVSYATVYPLTMLLRVVCAQVLVLCFS
jgi:putative transport protein